MDTGRIIRSLQAKLDEVKADGFHAILCSTEIIEDIIATLEEQEKQIKQLQKDKKQLFDWINR